MLKEELCTASERYLLATMIFSDKNSQCMESRSNPTSQKQRKNIAYEKFIKLERQENEIAVFTSYAYADFSIPKSFDCIFSYSNPEVYVQTKFSLTQSIWEAYYPIDYIDHGHKHLCILTFDSEIPEIFKTLHYETGKYSSWQWNERKVLGLCQINDLQSITENLQEKQG